MNIPKEAIEKAMEGRWRPEWTFLSTQSDRDGHFFHWTAKGGVVGMSNEQIALDPSFWQSLGKALGWTMNENIRVDRANAHDFYNLILTGGDTDAFWKELLKV